MKITETLYEEAWAKRDKATANFKAQLEADMIKVRALPSKEQRKAAIAAAERYEAACIPAVKEWCKELGIED